MAYCSYSSRLFEKYRYYRFFHFHQGAMPNELICAYQAVRKTIKKCVCPINDRKSSGIKNYRHLAWLKSAETAGVPLVNTRRRHCLVCRQNQSSNRRRRRTCVQSIAEEIILRCRGLYKEKLRRCNPHRLIDAPCIISFYRAIHEHKYINIILIAADGHIARAGQQCSPLPSAVSIFSTTVQSRSP